MSEADQGISEGVNHAGDSSVRRDIAELLVNAAFSAPRPELVRLDMSKQAAS